MCSTGNMQTQDHKQEDSSLSQREDRSAYPSNTLPPPIIFKQAENHHVVLQSMIFRQHVLNRQYPEETQIFYLPNLLEPSIETTKSAGLCKGWPAILGPKGHIFTVLESADVSD